MRVSTRAISLLLTLAMLLSFVPAGATVSNAAETEAAPFSGKTISILGDSISTFAGYIPTADGFNLEHLSRYPDAGRIPDVTAVEQTWWMQVVNGLGGKLGINDSWRGSMVSGAAAVTTGATGANAALSNLQRIRNLGANGTPDVILFYGGTNDYAHLSAIGTFDPASAPTEADLTTASWNNLADAYVQTLLRLRHYYPNARIVAMLPTYTASYYSDTKLAQGNAVLSQICTHYDIPFVDLRDSGVTAAHLPDGIHPGAEGMDLITEAVIDLLLDLEAPETGENVVHSVTHKLTGATASLGYFKGVTHGAAFSETLSGDALTVNVTMGGADITADCYADGKITIDRVTGELVITAAGRFDADGHLQQLPEKLCRGTNLWSVLTPDKQYYTVSGWGVHSSGKVYSITFPVSQGDQIYANSFGSGSVNGSGGTNGIRVTYFLEDGTVRSLPTNTVYSEFAANGYLTAPAGAIAVCVPMWTVSSSNTVRLLNAHHTYVNGVCTACSDASLPLEEVSGGLFRLTGSYADLSADLEIPAGTTLDLNGFDLNVAALVSFGQVIDSRGGGLLAAETFLPGAADDYLPIFDTSAGGYRFYAYTCKTLGVRATGNTAVFGFALNFADPAAYTLLTQTQNSGLSLRTKLSCGETDLSFVFSPELLRQYAQLCLDHPALTAALLLTVTGMDVIPSGEAVTAATFLTCADGQHSASFKTATYTKP